MDKVIKYLKDNDKIYDKENIKLYLYEYHIQNDMNFFIGLCEEDLTDLDKPISYEEFLLCEDWRTETGGSFYYRIDRNDNEYITLRMLLDQLKDNKICSSIYLGGWEENVLVDINKKTDIHYELYFDNNLNTLKDYGI